MGVCPCGTKHSRKVSDIEEIGHIDTEVRASPALHRIKLENSGRFSDAKDVTVHQSLFVSKKSGLITDHYDLGPILGDGATGHVRSCTYRTTGETRAVKII